VKTFKRIIQVFRNSPNAYYRWTAYEWQTVGTEVFRCREINGWNFNTDTCYHLVTDQLYCHNISHVLFTLPRIK
jgi:hypothetical protein